MENTASRVGLVKGADRRSNVYGSMELVRADIEAKVREQVLLKPNFLSSENQLASTHADAMRGAIDFLLSVPRPPDEIVIAEGGNEEYSGEAFDNFGYRTLPDEYDIPIRLVDLNEETQWEETTIFTATREERVVRMPKTVLACPCTISVAVAKTHDVCVVTLAQKNLIMGTLQKDDRIWMHGFPSHPDRILPDEAQVLNVNLIRLSRFLKADTGLREDGTIDPLVNQRIAANAPVVILPQYLRSLNALDGFAMDIGDKDFLLEGNRIWRAELDRFGVDYDFELYEGDHTNRVDERFADHVLPFFAQHLDGQGE